MAVTRTPLNELPLVRLNLALPLLFDLERLGIDVDAGLSELGLSVADIRDSDRFVPAPTMYRLVEKLAELSGDPWFGVHAGERVDPWNWSPLAEAAATAHTIGDFLIRFSISASEDASSVRYSLDTIGDRAAFHERRVTDGGILPRHNDGFSIAYLLSILRSAVGVAWDGREVVVHVCDPGVVPPGYLGVRLAAKDSLGASITFPIAWLLLKPHLKRGRPAAKAEPVEFPSAIVPEALRQALRPLLHRPDLNAVQVASLFGISKRTLARRLRQHNTSLKGEMETMRRHKAEKLLRDGRLSISEVGARVGYPETAVFSRAFKRWTGQRPTAFRARHQG